MGATIAVSASSAEALAVGPEEAATEPSTESITGNVWQDSQQPQGSSSGGWQSWLQPLEQHTARQQEVEEAKR